MGSGWMVLVSASFTKVSLALPNSKLDYGCWNDELYPMSCCEPDARAYL